MSTATTSYHQTSSSSSSHISWRPSFFSRRPAPTTTTTTTASSSASSSSPASMPLFGRRWLVRRSSIGELCPAEEPLVKKPSKSSKSKHTRNYKQQKRREVVMQFLHQEGLHDSIKNVWDSTSANSNANSTHHHRAHSHHDGGSHRVDGGSSELLGDESSSSYATASTCNFSFSSLDDPLEHEEEEDETASCTGSATSDCNDLPTDCNNEYNRCSQGVRWHPSVEEELERRRTWLLHNPPRLDPNRFRTRTRQRLEFVVSVAEEEQPEEQQEEHPEEEQQEESVNEPAEEEFVDALEEEQPEEPQTEEHQEEEEQHKDHSSGIHAVNDDNDESDSDDDDDECVIVGGRYFEI